jgi:CNT family concentrative nucleoside transporter
VSDLRGVLGLLVILGVAFLVSNNRSRIPWRTVAVGLTAQVVFAVLVLRWSVGKDVLDFVSGQVEALIGYTNAGIEFLFGKLVSDKKETIFALQVLPVIIFIGALVGLLYYLRVIQWIVEIVGGTISWAMRTTKVESLYAATVIFLGQSEAPLMIQSYLKQLTRSD